MELEVLEGLGLELEFGGESGDGGFFGGTDGGEGVNAGVDEFTGEVDEVGFVETFDEVGNVAVESVGFVVEIIGGVEVGDLGDGLDADVEATEGVGFGGGEVVVGDLTAEEFGEFGLDEVEEFFGGFEVDFAVEIPGGVAGADGGSAAHAVDEAFFAGLTEDATVHGTSEDVVEGFHGDEFGGVEAAGGDPGEAETEIAGVFATDELGVAGMEVVLGDVEPVASF